MFDVCNNRVYRVNDKFIIVSNVFGMEPKLLQAENLDERFETIYQVQTARECIDTFTGLVDKGLIKDVKGRTHFDAANAKIVIELEGVNVEQATAPVEKEEKVEVKEETKTKKNKKESKDETSK